ncbi:MAG: AAA family ATPase [Clostridia bacterium]|nr:AAA family ATPase [Clostridia bacterium]
MRIIECYIENFGKISKQKYEFKSGFNCIKEDNGSGKTTLAAFIKVMLYGMSDTKKSSLEENDRKHYLPWGGGGCGGSLTFECYGRIYRAERSFAPKAADDTLRIFDTATGREINDFSEGLGETLFGIDADGFERTVFLSERALTPKSDNKSISAKLSDLVGCSGDLGEMDKAMKTLEEQRKFYYKKGGSGELADTKAKIDEITRKLDALSETERALDAAREKLSKLSQEINSARDTEKLLLNERENATRRAAEANYEKQYADMKLSLENSLKRRTVVSEIFGENIPSFTDIDEASYKATEARNLEKSIGDSPERAEFARLSAKFDGVLDRERVEDAKSAIEAIRLSKKAEDDPMLKKAKKIFALRTPREEEISGIEVLLANDKHKDHRALIAYIPFATLCVLGFFLEKWLIAIGLVGIIVTLIIDLAIKSRKKKKLQSTLEEFFKSVSGITVSDKEEMLARLKDMSELLPVMLSANNAEDISGCYAVLEKLTLLFPDSLGSDIISRAEMIISEFEKYAALAVTERYIMGERASRAERADTLKKQVGEFLMRYKTVTADPFGELRTALTEYNRLTSEIIAKRDEMARLESLNKMGEDNQQKARLDIEQIDKKRRENEERLASLSRDYALTERLYASYSENLEMRDEFVMRRAELEETLARHNDNYNTVLLTKKYITAAKDNMTVRYLGKTKSGFLKYAEAIGGISGESFEMDTDFGVTKQEGASTKTVDAYSRGTRDLYNLAARLGLIDALYEKEKPFIILDDPFTAFDDKKTDAALKLLKEFSKEKQIIYFTCSKSRSI